MALLNRCVVVACALFTVACFGVPAVHGPQWAVEQVATVVRHGVLRVVNISCEVEGALTLTVWPALANAVIIMAIFDGSIVIALSRLTNCSVWISVAIKFPISIHVRIAVVFEGISFFEVVTFVEAKSTRAIIFRVAHAEAVIKVAILHWSIRITFSLKAFHILFGEAVQLPVCVLEVCTVVIISNIFLFVINVSGKVKAALAFILRVALASAPVKMAAIDIGIIIALSVIANSSLISITAQ